MEELSRAGKEMGQETLNAEEMGDLVAVKNVENNKD